MIKLTCVKKVAETTRAGVGLVRFYFEVQPPENAVRYGNLQGPVLSEAVLLVTDPSDFDAFEAGGEYMLVRAP